MLFSLFFSGTHQEYFEADKKGAINDARKILTHMGNSVSGFGGNNFVDHVMGELLKGAREEKGGWTSPKFAGFANSAGR